MLFELKAVTFETIQRIDVIPMVAGLIDNILVHQFAQALVHGLGANAGIVRQSLRAGSQDYKVSIQAETDNFTPQYEKMPSVTTVIMSTPSTSRDTIKGAGL